jgi:DNA-binding XRE family transcriptional regulator
VTNPPLDILDGPSRIALVPSPIESFGDDSELDDQIGGEVLLLDFATFFPPQAEQGVFVGAHDDTGIGTANEVSAAFPGGWSRGNICSQIDRHGEVPCALFRHALPRAPVTIANKMPVTNAQVRMARAALNWTVRDLAEATGLHRNTISNIEVGRYAGNQESISVIEKVLRDAGVEFIAENGKGPGVRLSKPESPTRG